MSSQMYRLPYTDLLIFCCFTFVCVHGRGQDLFPSCDVELMVRRGLTWKTAPQQCLTVECPVKHCGESLNVTWCKLLDTNKCEQISCTENVEIRQNNKDDADNLISFLTFKRISIYDDGLYRCGLEGNKFQYSHIINISVSELNQGVKNCDDNSDDLPNVAVDEDMPWLPYFSICVSIALLVVTLTVLTLLSFNGWKRTLTFNHTKGQEMSTHVIPDLPKRDVPSTPVLQAQFPIQNYIYSPSTSERPQPRTITPSLITNGNQPAVANTADAVYAVINHRQSGTPARGQHAATEQDKKAEYATINVS